MGKNLHSRNDPLCQNELNWSNTHVRSENLKRKGNSGAEKRPDGQISILSPVEGTGKTVESFGSFKKNKQTKNPIKDGHSESRTL